MKSIDLKFYVFSLSLCEIAYALKLIYSKMKLFLVVTLINIPGFWVRQNHARNCHRSIITNTVLSDNIYLPSIRAH